MREPQLQQLVMDVLAVRSKNRATADQAAKYRERGFQDGKSEGNHGDRHRNHGRRFLGAFQRQCTQEKTDEQASGVAEENRSRVEVKTQKSEHRATECERN